MGLFGGNNDDGKQEPHGFYIGTFPIWENQAAADARREDREDRQQTRKDAHTDRIETRQDAHTDRVDSRSGRVETRQDARTDRTDVRNADGKSPLDDVANGASGLFGNLMSGLGGITSGLGSGILAPLVPIVAIGGAAVLGVVIISKLRSK